MDLTNSGLTEVDQDTCDNATMFTLANGHLIHDGQGLDKSPGATVVPFDTWKQADSTEPGDISFVDGVLHWDTPDVGSSIFYVCD